MKKIIIAIFIISTSFVIKSFAQGTPAGASMPTLPPGTRPQGAPALLDLATAKSLAEATAVAAKSANANVAISVVDANGDLVYFIRMDGASGGGITASQAKARGAILFGLPTKTVSDAAASGTAINAIITPSGVGGSAISIQQGGIPIIKNGKVIGGIGAGGSSSANDESFVKAALGLK